MPAHHQQGTQINSQPPSVVPAPILPSPPAPAPSTILSSTSPTSFPLSHPSTSSTSWRGPRTPSIHQPTPSPCFKCGSWAKSHSPSRCKRRQHRAGLHRKERKTQSWEPTYSLSVVMDALKLVEVLRWNSSFFPHQPFFSFGGGGKWDPGVNFEGAYRRGPLH